MEVICIETSALLELCRKVIKELKPEFDISQNEWLDPAEAMTLLNCKKTKLQSLRDNGEIAFSQPSRKIILYSRTSIIGYLAKHTKQTF